MKGAVIAGASELHLHVFSHQPNRPDFKLQCRIVPAAAITQTKAFLVERRGHQPLTVVFTQQSVGQNLCTGARIPVRDRVQRRLAGWQPENGRRTRRQTHGHAATWHQVVKPAYAVPHTRIDGCGIHALCSSSSISMDDTSCDGINWPRTSVRARRCDGWSLALT